MIYILTFGSKAVDVCITMNSLQQPSSFHAWGVPKKSGNGTQMETPKAKLELSKIFIKHKNKNKDVDLQMVKTRQRSKPKFQPGHRQTIQRERQKSKHQVQPLKKKPTGNTGENIQEKPELGHMLQARQMNIVLASFPFSPGASNVNSGQLLIGSFWCPAGQSDVMLLAARYKKGLLQDLCLPCALCSQSAWVCVAFLQHDRWLCCGPSRFSHTLFFSRRKRLVGWCHLCEFSRAVVLAFLFVLVCLVRPSYVVLISLVFHNNFVSSSPTFWAPFVFCWSWEAWNKSHFSLLHWFLQFLFSFIINSHFILLVYNHTCWVKLLKFLLIIW